MPTSELASTTASPFRRLLGSPIGQRWPLVLGFAALAVGTIISLSQQVWTREAGAHGPIVLATGLWLFWRATGSMRELAAPGNALLSWLAFVPGLALYVFGRAFDFISLETAGLYVVGLSMLHASVGIKAMEKNWFPIFYLAFLVPPPEWFMDKFTGPLKQFVSWVATDALHFVGLPIAREGVTIHVAQYQLLMEDACSGMNSLVGLAAISLFYIYLLRGSSFIYSAILTLFVVPIAIIGNILRVMILILLTYFFGDQVAQGFAHDLAGIFLFAVDLLLVFALDSVLFRFMPKTERAA